MLNYKNGEETIDIGPNSSHIVLYLRHKYNMIIPKSSYFAFGKTLFSHLKLVT